MTLRSYSAATETFRPPHYTLFPRRLQKHLLLPKGCQNRVSRASNSLYSRSYSHYKVPPLYRDKRSCCTLSHLTAQVGHTINGFPSSRASNHVPHGWWALSAYITPSSKKLSRIDTNNYCCPCTCFYLLNSSENISISLNVPLI